MRTRWFLAVALLAGCQPIAQRPAPPPAMNVVVHLYSDGQMSIDNKSAMTPDLLQNALALATQRVVAGGNEIGDMVVTIAADGQATCGMLKDVVNRCQRCRIENFALQLAPEHPFRMPLSRPAGEIDLPALRVRLQARADGSLAGSEVASETLDSLDSLQRRLIELVGEDRGPGSVYETTPIEFVADDQLRVAELARVYAVMSYQAGDGQRLLVAKHVSPMPAFDESEEYAEPPETTVEIIPIE